MSWDQETSLSFSYLYTTSRTKFAYCKYSAKYDFHFKAAIRKFKCECWEESWTNSYMISFLLSVKQKRSHLLRVRGRWKCLLKAKKLNVSLHRGGDQRKAEESLDCAEGSAVVGQCEFEVFPNFPVFWFPPTVLSCSGVSIKKINPSGVNQEQGRRLLIYKKHNAKV